MRIFNIPNAITSMNLLSGILGVICALDGRMDMALALMILAAVFDFFDGMAARALGVSGDIGKELDSLSDMVSFGVLPALMLMACMQECGNTSWVSYIPLLLAVMSSYRLAKFNLDKRQESDFLGVPTPTAAIISGTLVYYISVSGSSTLNALAASWWFIPAIAIVLSFLLVSEIPMFGMKIKKGHKLLDTKRIVFLVLALVSIVLTVVLKQNWALAILLIFSAYILENLLLFVFAQKK